MYNVEQTTIQFVFFLSFFFFYFFAMVLFSNYNADDNVDEDIGKRKGVVYLFLFLCGWYLLFKVLIWIVYFRVIFSMIFPSFEITIRNCGKCEISRFKMATIIKEVKLGLFALTFFFIWMLFIVVGAAAPCWRPMKKLNGKSCEKYEIWMDFVHSFYFFYFFIF